jgi:zinc/manganese transport system substrate-binding protein
LRKCYAPAGGAILKLLLGVVCVVSLLTSACGLAGDATTSSGMVEVVAAENFWGSIASQIGGDRVHVTSIIDNPNTDPHDYEPTPNDARLIARAAYVIVNGAGYDPWASKLAAANPVASRRILVIAGLAGVQEGGNPHMWYSPDIVARVIERITYDFQTIDSAGAGYFDQHSSDFKAIGLKDYHETIAAIKQKYAGTPVGASESIVAYMAPAVGLNLITPPAYLKAISEGTDPSAADKVTVDQQVTQKRIRVFVFNSQNSSPDVQSVVDKAKAAGISVVQITETLTPATASFQEWQTNQLKALLTALGG